MSNKNVFVEKAIELFKDEANLDNALERKVGYDLDGNYYFYLSGLEHEDPSGNWDLDIYTEEDSPYYMLRLNHDGDYNEMVYLGKLNSHETVILNNKNDVILVGGKEIPRLSERETSLVIAIKPNHVLEGN